MGGCCLARTSSPESIAIWRFRARAASNPSPTIWRVCHPSIQKNNGKLSIADAEEAWFVRVNHIEHYGTDVHLERLTAEAPEPLLFLNIDAVPRGRALIWEHIADAPGKPCPNPRVVIPRSVVPDIVNAPVRVDIRSFGVRTPPCTKENPTYGIIGLFHILPPALAWLWRLVAPRGHANPSIIESNGMSRRAWGRTGRSPPAGASIRPICCWPSSATTPNTRYILSPSQYIGAWRVGFMPQWVTREYMARRGTARLSRDSYARRAVPCLATPAPVAGRRTVRLTLVPAGEHTTRGG